MGELLEREGVRDRYLEGSERKSLPNTVLEEDEILEASASLHRPTDPPLDTPEFFGGPRRPTYEVVHDETGIVKQPEDLDVGQDFEQSDYPVMTIVAERAPAFHAILRHYPDLTSLCIALPTHYSQAALGIPYCPTDGISFFVPNDKELVEFSNLTMPQMKLILMHHIVRRVISLYALDSGEHFAFETLLQRTVLPTSGTHSIPSREPSVPMDKLHRIAIDMESGGEVCA